MVIPSFDDNSSSHVQRSMARCRRLATTLVLGWMLLFSAPAALAAEPNVDTAQRRRVLFVHEQIPLYLDLDSAAQRPLDRVAIQQTVRRYLMLHPYFEVVPRDEIMRALRSMTSAEEWLPIAQSNRQSGIQLFFKFSFKQAIEDLKRAQHAYLEAHGELLAPEELAEVYQYQAFAALELINSEGDPERLGQLQADSGEAFEALVRLTPGRVVDPIHQPPERVRYYQQARVGFLRDLSRRNKRQETQAKTLSRYFKARIDHLFFSRIVQRASGEFVLEVRIYDVGLAAFTFQDEVLLPEETTDTLERTSAMLSRFVSCLKPRPLPRQPARTQAGRLLIDVAFSYLRFIEQPTREPFDNLGASFSVAYMINENVSVFTRLYLDFSGQDARGDLLSNFNTIRSATGVGLSVDVSDVFRLYFQTGLELSTVSDFSVTFNLTCKAFGVQPEVGCPQGALDHYSVDMLGGINSTLGFNLGYDPVFFSAQASGAFYFIPFNETKVLNYPLSFEIGVQYRFF